MRIALFFLFTGIAHAELVVTEVMAKSKHVGTAVNGDWWELTNTGSNAVDLEDFTWDDEPTPSTPSISTFPAFIIQPGESIIILQEDSTSVAAWRSAWGIPATVRVLARNQFNPGGGGESFSGFSSGGDEVNLYDVGGDRVSHVDFDASIEGVTKAFLRDGRPIYGLNSSNGEHGAGFSTQNPADLGSPGDAGIHFTTPPPRFAEGSLNHDIAAEAPGAASVSFQAGVLPSFLTLTDAGGGTADLSSNRALVLADAGDYLIEIEASGGGNSTTQKFLISVLNPDPTVVLNEYNAVSDTEYLNGGTAVNDSDGGDASTDSYFGRVVGNGGDWVEFVVVGDGGPSRVDLRGWKVEIGTDQGTGFEVTNTVVLSDHMDWAEVPTGTLLTFIEKNGSQGGVDTGFAIRDQREANGDTWTNIWIGDSTYLDYTSSFVNGYTVSGGVVAGIEIDNTSTQFRVLDGNDQIVFGPVGEGVAPQSGTSSVEVFELENHPSPAISPAVESGSGVLGYDDGAAESTFGERNSWLGEGGTVTQDFEPYRATGFVLWAEGLGLEGADALPGSDPEQDNRNNEAEYAFGGNPMVKDAAYPSGPILAGSEVEWTYIRRAGDSDLSFSYEASEALDGSWAPVTPISESTSPFAGDPDFETVTARFSYPVPRPDRWFVRANGE